jgi:hypothetical protein
VLEPKLPEFIEIQAERTGLEPAGAKGLLANGSSEYAGRVQRGD